MFRLLALLLLLVSAGFVPPAFAAQGDGEPARDAILVLDASGSMWARMDGRPQIVVAKEVVLGLLDDLSANYRLGLMAYGHRRKGDCSDIEMMVDVGGSRDAIRAAVKGISPKGKTPMTQAVIDAAKALKYTENQATVILVSDGKESCGMDPCAAARKLEELGVDLTVHAIGFGMEKGSDGLKQVQCFAKNTGGQFFAANNAQELTEALAQVSVAKPEPPAKVEVKLRATDQKGGPVIEQGLIWTVRNGATGKVVYQSAAPEGSVAVEMLRGVHDASVLRVSDEAGADGEIETGTSGTTVTLPIVVKLKASLKAPASAPAGSLIEVAWTGPAFPGDYIGIFAAGDEDNRFGDISQDNAVKGEPAELRLPSKPGPYEVRYIVRKNYEAIASEQITVTPVKATLDVPPSAPAAASITIEWTGPGYPGDYIGIFPVGDEGNRYGMTEVRLIQGEPAKLQLPSKPGSYEIRYVVTKGYKAIAVEPIEVTPVKATLSVPTTAKAAVMITIKWTGPGYPGDYIGIFPVGDEGNRYGISEVRLVQGEPAKLQLPSKPGSYEVRYVVRKGYKAIASEQITVTPVKATLSVPPTAKAEDLITVEWTGPGYPGDYIGIFPVGDEGNRYGISEVRLVQGVPAKLQLPSKPGSYEVRYVVRKGYKSIGSEPIEVTQRPIDAAQAGQMQRGIDRPGSDYRKFDVKGKGAKACHKACLDDSRCRAWAWTEPGYQSAGGLCWLKNAVPEPVPMDAAVSGVVRP